MQKYRFRFAPSPTGHLHIGSVRTAVYNWLLARHFGEDGAFVLRIEDTDLERSSEESVQSILEAMRWIGLDWDEGPEVGGSCGPYFQTQRTEIYLKYIEKLLEKGRAYRCYATPEELEEMRKQAAASKGSYHYDRRWRDKSPEDWPEDRPYVIRFKAPTEGTVVIDDMIKGRVEFDVDQHIDDFIIARSDGSPTYNFTVVVDDLTMGITHVLRGDDHLSNTPKQQLLYEALDFKVPRFAHMPLTLGTDRTRLSKRHGATSVQAYREMGYLPHALLNYLVRLGWAHGDKEIFSVEELVKLFSIESVSKSSGIFDQEKLLWINHQYIMNDPPMQTAKALLPFLALIGVETQADERLAAIVTEVGKRCKTLVDMAAASRFFYSDDFEYVPKADKKYLKRSGLDLLKELATRLEALDSFDAAAIKTALDAVMEERELKLGKIAQPLRVAVTGTAQSPGIYETLELLGQAATIKRLKKAIEHVEAKPET